MFVITWRYGEVARSVPAHGGTRERELRGVARTNRVIRRHLPIIQLVIIALQSRENCVINMVFFCLIPGVVVAESGRRHYEALRSVTLRART